MVLWRMKGVREENIFSAADLSSRFMERRPDSELPAWLARLRTKFANTPEFKALSNELYNRIRDDVREGGLPSFSDLSEEERRVMVGRAQAALLERESYGAARDAAWRSLDVSLDAEADAWLAERRAPGTPGLTKVDALVELAGTGATRLLARWPESTHSQLLWLLNADLPGPLRRAVWTLKLSAPTARAEFERRRAESRLAVMSLRDGAVLEHCQVALQQAEPMLLAQLPLMRGALSYVDSLSPLEEAGSSGDGGLAVALLARERPSHAGADEAPPLPLEYWWSLPLLRVFGEAAEAEVLERFVALLAAPKPTLELEPSAAATLALGGAGDVAAAEGGEDEEALARAEALLTEADPVLLEALTATLGGDGLDGFLAPVAQRLGVGVLSPAATAWAWDLCLLGGWAQLQVVLAALLLALRDGLLGCGSEEAVATFLLQEAPRVPVSTLRPLMERHFMPAVREALNAPAAVGDEGMMLWGGSASQPQAAEQDEDDE